MSPEFHERTTEYIKKTSLDYRHRHGQYFTPRSIREALLSKLPCKGRKIRILDPASGTGEFLISARERYPDADIEGWEIDPELVRISKKIAPFAKIVHKDSLKDQENRKFDLIIGNPPYFEFSPDEATRRKFSGLLNGRPNIFGLFIKLGLDLLREGGYLAYVVPPSMNNGAYFSKVRDYIIRNSNIECLEIIKETSLFHGALQMVMLLVLKKGKNQGAHIFCHRGIRIFTESPEFLRRSFAHSVSLKELGYKVRTGRLVWNQHKEELTNDPAGALPLLWAHNITASGLVFPILTKRPQFVKVDYFDQGPAILVNRITGAGRHVKIRAALIPAKMKFIAENHCNVVFPPDDRHPGELVFKGPDQSKPGLVAIYEQLISPDKIQVMKKITGNTQISKTELENLFPISI